MLKIIQNKFYKKKVNSLFNCESSEKARNFHKTIDTYQVTPLIQLRNLAKKLKVANIYVKDESHRFGLNAFKVLGSSYAVAKIIAAKHGFKDSEIHFDTLVSLADKPIVLATATAGNHGTGIAWVAQKMRQKAVIYMPKGVVKSSVERAQKLGAQVIVTDVNYDDTVRLATKNANENNWILVQDTAWQDYTQIPTWISQGYMTMAQEVVEQITAQGKQNFPTHIFLQAGVGAMAGGVLGYFVDALSQYDFTIIIVEPSVADCLYQSISTPQGDLSTVLGELNSIMAGLACGVPNPVTWKVIRDNANFFMTVPDSITLKGMDVLTCPIENDIAINSGPSGAVGIGVLQHILSEEGYRDMVMKIGLNESSRILIFNTEASHTKA